MIKLYNSELQINLKISNLPIDLFSDLNLFDKIKESIKNLSYEIITETKDKQTKIFISPIVDVQMVFVEKNNFLNFITQRPDSNSLLITINAPVLERFNLPISKVKKTIEILLNKIIDELISEPVKQERKYLNTIESVTQKIKKYETLLAKSLDNKKETDRIGNRLIKLNKILTQLKDKKENEKPNEETDFPFSNF